MKTKRTLSMLLIFLMLVLTLAGCKKKDKETDDAVTPTLTPTPEPVTVQELFDKTETELKTLFTKSTGDGTDKYTISFPDGKMSANGLFQMKMNIMGLVKFDIDMNLVGNLTSKDNLGDGDAHIDMTMTTSSMFAEENKTDSENSNVKIYIDNTNGDEITVYTNENNSVWEKSTKSIKEAVEAYTEKLESFNVDIEDQDANAMFKNSEQFRAEKTKLTETAVGYTITTAFSWEEFYNTFKDDMDKLASEVAGSLASALPGSISVEDMVKDFYGNGRGNFSMIADFDKEKTLKDFQIKVDDFYLATQIKDGDEEGLPLSFNISSLDLKITLDRDASVSVTIPEDVRANAVEAAVEDNNTDEPFIIPDPDDITDVTAGDDNNNIGGADDPDYTGELPEKITLEQNGIYYILVGGQTISLPFPAEWNPDISDYAIDVYPEQNLVASYTDSYVTIEENAISSDLSSFVDYYENTLGASDFTVTFSGAAQPSFVFVINNETQDYQNVTLLQYVPGSQHYLNISIIDLTKTADPMDLIQKFAISF